VLRRSHVGVGQVLDMIRRRDGDRRDYTNRCHPNGIWGCRTRAGWPAHPTDRKRPVRRPKAWTSRARRGFAGLGGLFGGRSARLTVIHNVRDAGVFFWMFDLPTGAFYCKPSCARWPPKPERAPIIFFPLPSDEFFAGGVTQPKNWTPLARTASIV